MEFGVLGPVRALAGGDPINLGPRKQRLVLAVLLLEANRLVGMSSIVRAVWPDDPPPSAHRVVHGHVSRLRGILAKAGADRYGVALDRHGAGYLIRCDLDRVDAHRFRDLVRQARATDDDEKRVELLDRALDLWHGVALSDVAADDVRERLCVGLSEARIAARQDRWDAQLRLGRHRSILDELVAQAPEYPRQQRVTGQLMLAYYRCGRVQDALETYWTYRQRLVDEFGIEPNPGLRRLETAILQADPALEPVPTPLVTPAAPTPALLPPDIPGFAGRHDQLDLLDRLLGGARGGIAVISGPGGVGKTALAVRWARRAGARFPDGQLYVDLHGFDPGGRATRPDEAVRGFLDALDVPADRMPTGLEAQTGRYRSLLAGKRMLVLLDNARDAEHVRPLLPATPSVVTVVTSRSQLMPLVAVEGAHPLTLDVLTRRGARDLLRSRLGAERTGAEPAAVETIIEACARLPLALSIVAARVRAGNYSLAGFAAELAGHRLDALDAGDASSSVRTVFAGSLAAVSPAAGRLFRVLGRHPGADISLPAAAALAGRPAEETRSLLTELIRAGLLGEHLPGRYTCHDLLRAYAADLPEVR